ncbi:MAG TPA: hypothetical protein VN643_27965 [Pyrinomonadaceae bacterium]|nr:hypothetical protein [Pyrinomonadaceae bacterium]
MLVPQNQKLPDAFDQLPEEVGEQATIILTGTYAEGRGPCIFMPDGSRRWALESWFNVKKVYRGKVGGKTIHINSRVSAKMNDVSVKLEVGQDYLVLLRPNEESMKAIKAGEYVPAWEALHGEEIIAIVKFGVR